MPDAGSVNGEAQRATRMNWNVRLTLLYAVLLSMCASLLSQTPLAYFILLLRHENHLAVGSVTGLQGVLSLLTAIPASFAADRFGRQVVLRLGAAVGFSAVAYTAVCLLVLRGRISDEALYWCLCGASSFFGFWMGLHAAPLEALFGDSIESGRRSRLYVLRSALRTSGTALGPFVSIVVFSLYGDKWKPSELVSVMVLGCCVATLPCSILCFFRDSRALGNLSEGLLSAHSERCERAERTAAAAAVLATAAESAAPKPRRRCRGLDERHVAPLIACTDLVSMLGSGMTANFIPLWFGQKLHLHPIAVNGLLMASPIGIALAALLAQRLSMRVGRIAVAVSCRLGGVMLLLTLSLVEEPLGVLPLYLLHRWLINCTTGLTKSVLNDYVRTANRSRWNALESLNLLSWSGSAALGGKLIDLPGVGYRHTFQITAAVQLCSVLLLLPLLSVVSAEKDAKGGRAQLRSTTSAHLLSDDSLGSETPERAAWGSNGPLIAAPRRDGSLCGSETAAGGSNGPLIAPRRDGSPYGSETAAGGSSGPSFGPRGAATGVPVEESSHGES